jgi:hypothetical protein
VSLSFLAQAQVSLSSFSRKAGKQPSDNRR